MMRGGDTTALRAYNERLVIDAIRRDGPLSQADIARVTGLSGQSASVIVKRLLTSAMVTKGAKVHGRIGQPSTPIRLNPQGAYSLGVKIGRRSVEAVLVDLTGNVVGHRYVEHAFPDPEPSLSTAKRIADELLDDVGAANRSRVVGLGIAMPGELHAWSGELGLDADSLDGWRHRDVAAELEEAISLPATLYNDATAACAAEMIAGESIKSGTVLYLYLGTFIGAGVTIDGKLYVGSQLNAGAFGSMPTCHQAPSGRPAQLLRLASINALEQALEEAGHEPTAADGEIQDPAVEAIFDTWLKDACTHVARATVSALAVIDFDAVVIDGMLSANQRSRFKDRLKREVGWFDLRGVMMPEFATGSIGPRARVLGAALMPLQARFSPDPGLLVSANTQRAA